MKLFFLKGSIASLSFTCVSNSNKQEEVAQEGNNKKTKPCCSQGLILGFLELDIAHIISECEKENQLPKGTQLTSLCF